MESRLQEWLEKVEFQIYLEQNSAQKKFTWTMKIIFRKNAQGVLLVKVKVNHETKRKMIESIQSTSPIDASEFFDVNQKSSIEEK